MTSDALTAIGTLGAALVVDRVLGEPPNVAHPVVWIGTTIRSAQRLAPARGKAAQLLFGSMLALVVPSAFALSAHQLLRALQPWPAFELLLGIFLLKSTFSLQGLLQAGARMRDALAHDLDRARYELRSLCSRDPSTLDAPELIGATVESLAENTSDSFVAPLLYYACFGVPGAIAYRAVNTLDSMVGYHGAYEYLGKASARLDDVLNLVPARLCAACLLVAGRLAGEDAGRGWRIALRDGAATESPNAGHPMAAMAGLLGVRLEKAGCYRLGDPAQPLTSRTIERALRVVTLAGVLFSAWLIASIGALHALG